MDNYIERVLERMGDRQDRHDPPVDLLSPAPMSHVLVPQTKASQNPDGSVTVQGGEWITSTIAFDVEEVR